MSAPVPWVTRWSAEQPAGSVNAHIEVRQTAVSTRERLSFHGERPEDRDQFGILWIPSPQARGKGEPEFAQVHPHRQRAAMDDPRCQVCGAPAEQRELVLLLTQHERREGRTAQPPVCPACLPVALHACPHLRRGYRDPFHATWEPIAVIGDVILAHGQLTQHGRRIDHADPLIDITIARQRVIAFTDLIDHRSST